MYIDIFKEIWEKRFDEILDKGFTEEIGESGSVTKRILEELPEAEENPSAVTCIDPEVAAAAATADNNLEEDITSILGEKYSLKDTEEDKEQVEAPDYDSSVWDGNLFIATLRREFGEGMDSIVRKLYTLRRRMTKQEFIELNHAVYDVVIDNIKNRQFHSYTVLDSMVNKQTGYPQGMTLERMDINDKKSFDVDGMTSRYTISSPDLQNASERAVYNPHIVSSDGVVTFDEGLTVNFKNIGNLTGCMDRLISRYKGVHKDADIEEDLFEQLGALDRDNDPIGASRLRPNVSGYLAEIVATIEDMQIKIAQAWLHTPVLHGINECKTLGTNAYGSGSTPAVRDVIYSITCEPDPDRLFNTGILAEKFFNMCFHRDTAVEDIIRLAGMAISGDDVCYRPGEKVEQPFIINCLPSYSGTKVILSGKHGDGRFKISDADICDIIKCIISPVGFVSIAGNTLVEMKYDNKKGTSVGRLSGRLLEAMMEGYMDPAYLYRVFFAKCSEMTLMALSEALAEDCMDYLLKHPVYVALMDIEKSDLEDVDMAEVPVEEYNRKLSIVKDGLTKSLKNMLTDYFKKILSVAIGMNIAFMSILHTLSPMLHKLYGMFIPDSSLHMVAGLSANLIHLMDARENGKYIIAEPASSYAWKHDSLWFSVSLPEKLADFAEHVGKKDSPVCMIQDRHEFVITSGAQVFYNTARNMSLHVMFSRVRKNLCSRYIVISNTRPMEPSFIEDIMTTGNSIGKSSGRIGKLTSFIKSNMSETAWPFMTKDLFNKIRTDKPRSFAESEKLLRTPSVLYDKNQLALADRMGKYTADSYDKRVYRLVDLAHKGRAFTVDNIDPSILSVTRTNLGHEDIYRIGFLPVLNNIHGDRYCRGKNLLLLSEDPSEGTGYGQMVDYVFGRYTVWNSRYVKLFKKCCSSPKVIGSDGLVSGELMLPLVSNEYHVYGPNLKVQPCIPSLGDVGTVVAYAPLGRHTFKMDDIQCCAWDMIKIETLKEEVALEIKDDARFRLSKGISMEKVDWKGMLSGLHSSSTVAGRYMPDRFRNVPRSQEDNTDYSISLLKWNSRNAYGLNPSVRIDMLYYMNDYTFYEDISKVGEDQFFSDIKGIFDRAFPLKDMLEFTKEAASGIDIIDEVDVVTKGKKNEVRKGVPITPEDITPVKVITDGSVEYRSESGEKESLAKDMAKSYSDFVLKGKSCSLDILKSKAGSLYAQYKEMLRAKEDLEAEIEAIKNNSAGDDITSAIGRVKRMVDSGLVLDYTQPEGAEYINVVLSAPRIWVGGYIYIMSPGILKVPFNLKSGANSRLNISAIKDLMVMQLEALKYLGAKYGIGSLEEMYMCNDDFNNISPSMKGSSYDYPHVHNREGCMGSSSTEMHNAIISGDISMYVKTAQEYIKSVTIRDGWGKGIISWPCIPATLFNLMKHGLIGTMDVTMDSRIVIPGKVLKKGKLPEFAKKNITYMDSPAAMVDVRDVSSEMLQYLLEEADSIEEETDYNYLHSFGSDYCDYLSTAFTTPIVFGGTSLKSLYQDVVKFRRASRFRDMMMEYAYLTQGKGAGEEAYKINRAIVEGGIYDINVFRSAIRRAPDNGSWNCSDWDRTEAIEPVSLEGDTVIVGSK